jgi:hypothetical protein
MQNPNVGLPWGDTEFYIRNKFKHLKVIYLLLRKGQSKRETTYFRSRWQRRLQRTAVPAFPLPNSGRILPNRKDQKSCIVVPIASAEFAYFVKDPLLQALSPKRAVFYK